MGAGLFAITAVAFLRPPLLPDIGRDLGLSPLGLGALGSAFALGRLTADSPAGALTDRSRPGSMMAIAATIVAAGSLAFGLFPAAAIAFVAAFVLGIGSTWTLTGSMAFFARAPRVNRGMSMSVPFFLRNPGIAPDIDTDDDGASPRQPIPRHILAVLYLLPAVQFSIGAAMIQTLVPIVGDEELGLGAAMVGLAIGLGGIARLVGAVVSGRVSDGMGRKWALVPGLTFQTMGLVLFALVGGTIAWWLAILGLTLGSVAVNVGSTILADLSEEGGLGRLLGAFRFAGELAFLITPVLSGALYGALYEVSGRFLGTLPLLLLTAAAALGCLFVLPETLPRRA